MKNRFYILLAIGFLFRLPLAAQAPECKEIAKQISESLKLKKYADAAGVFEKMPVLCAVNDDALFADSETVLNYIIQQSKTPDTKKAHVETLAGLYDQYDKAHPQNTKGLKVRKAMLIDANKTATDDVVYSLLDQAFVNDRANFTDAKALYRYFELMIAKQKAGDKAIAEETIFSRYDEVSIHLKKLSATADDKMAKRYRSTGNGLRAMVAPMTDCGKLTKYYEKEIQNRETDGDWLEAVAKGIFGKTCGNSPLYQEIVQKWFAVAPSAESAETIALASMRSNQKEKGIDYMEQAIGFEKDAVRRAQLRYQLAVFAQSDKEKATMQLKKAVEENPKFGKAYLLLAQTYANSTACAKTPFEAKALNLLAAQTVQKAGAVDAGLKTTAAKQAEAYAKKGPGADEIKQEKMAGKQIKFDCWINESVTIPKG